MSENEPPKHSLTRNYLVIAASLVLLDQGTKIIVLNAVAPFSVVKVTEYLNIALVFNKGAAFGFLNEPNLQPNLVFMFASVVILVVLAWMFWSMRPGHNQTSLAICLIFGGAVGNLIDRVVHGHVVDFIDFHYANWHFYTFNVADSAISIGGAILVLELIGIRIIFRR